MAEKITCCPTDDVEAVVDYSQHGGARSFLERIGVEDAHRLPGPLIQPGCLRVHSIPLHTPLPHAELQGHFNGESPPDQGKTLDWPHPDLKREDEERVQ